MTPLTTADRQGCAVLDLPSSVPEASITSVTSGADAVEMLARDADATRQAAQVMRRAHDHGWVVVARGNLGGGVRCHTEAFFESMADAEHAAGALDRPAGTVLEWAPGLTPDQYEPGGDLMPLPLAGVQLHGPRFTPPGLEVVVIDTDGLEALCETPDSAFFKRALELPDRPDLADPGVGGPLARRLALEGLDEARRPM